MKPDPEMMKGIADFPRPKTQTDVRALLDQANQFTTFVPDLVQVCPAIRSLLGRGNAFVWTPAHEAEFLMIKKNLTSPMLVKPFNPEYDMELLTDPSRLFGLGFALIQKSKEGQVQLVRYG